MKLKLSKQLQATLNDAGRWITVGGHHIFIKDKAPQESTTEKVLKGGAGLAVGATGAIAGEQIGQYTGALAGGAIGSIFPGAGTAIGAGIGAFTGGALGSALGGYGATELSEAIGGHSAGTGAAIGSIVSGVGGAVKTGVKGLAHFKDVGKATTAAKGLAKLKDPALLKGAKHVGHGIAGIAQESLGAAGMISELSPERKLKLRKIMANQCLSHGTLQKLPSFTVNFGAGIKRVTHNGTEYFVAPLTMIVPGILHGSKGPLLYREKELQQNVAAWNGVPLTVQHPSMNGIPVSAKYKGVWEQQGIGFVKNAQYRGKLVAEGWFDAKRTKRISPATYNALVSGQPIELSTGLFTENVPVKNGLTHKGRSYTHIATNFKPDHLAILPDRRGACSIKDGCGVMVNDSKLRKIVDTYITDNDWKKWNEEHSGQNSLAKTATHEASFATAKADLHTRLPGVFGGGRATLTRLHQEAANHHRIAVSAHRAAYESTGNKTHLEVAHSHREQADKHEQAARSVSNELQQIVNDWYKWDHEHASNRANEASAKANSSNSAKDHLVAAKAHREAGLSHYDAEQEARSIKPRNTAEDNERKRKSNMHMNIRLDHQDKAMAHEMEAHRLGVSATQQVGNDWAKWNATHKGQGGGSSPAAPDPIKATQSRIGADIAADLGAKKPRASSPARLAHTASKNAEKLGTVEAHQAAAKAHRAAAYYHYGIAGEHVDTATGDKHGDKAWGHDVSALYHDRKAKAAMPFYKRIFNSADCPKCGGILNEAGKCEKCKYQVSNVQQIVNDWFKWDQEHKGEGSDSDMAHRFGGDGGPEPASPNASKAFTASELANKKGTAKAHMSAAIAHDLAYKENHNPIHLQQATAHRGFAQSVPKGRGVIDRGIGAVHGAESGGIHGALAGTVIGGALGAVKGQKRLGKLGAVIGGAEGAWHGFTRGLKGGAAVGAGYGALHNEQVKRLKDIIESKA